MGLREDLESLLKPLPRRYLVAFALHCAKDVRNKAKDKALVNACISLVEEWLELGPSKELEQRLRNAANATADAVYAAYAANAAANAAAYAANATAANAAAYAANAAAYAAYAANADAYADADAKMKEYKEVLIGMIHSMPRVEKMVFNVEEV